MISDVVDYSVGSMNDKIILCIHNEIASTTLEMNEVAVVKMIRLLAATLENHFVDIEVNND